MERHKEAFAKSQVASRVYDLLIKLAASRLARGTKDEEVEVVVQRRDLFRYRG